MKHATQLSLFELDSFNARERLEYWWQALSETVAISRAYADNLEMLHKVLAQTVLEKLRSWHGDIPDGDFWLEKAYQATTNAVQEEWTPEQRETFFADLAADLGLTRTLETKRQPAGT